jgi:predicted PolB exonuclease-like 3'-5' exonuclease
MPGGAPSSSQHVIVWDLETIPDAAAAARIAGASNGEVEEPTEGEKPKFPRLPLHQIACIGALIAEKEEAGWSVRALGAPHMGERTERELITAFVERIALLRPKLVTFNGQGFDLPVLRYRAMLHSVPAPGLSARPYFNRYTEDAVDLCDVLSSFDGRGKVSLDMLCRTLNLPGKPDGIEGSQVARFVRDGRIQEVADYCETDVVNTYRVWLRYELFRGALAAAEFEASEAALTEHIRGKVVERPHLAHVIDR